MRTFTQWLSEGGDSRNAVHTNTDTHTYATPNSDFDLPNILFVTGMNSSGYAMQVVAGQGYPVKHVSTNVNWPATITGRIKRYPILKQTMGWKANRMGDAHITDQIQKVNSELPKNWEPDIVIGTSQGGAVVLAMTSFWPNAKFILACPAWKVFNVKPNNLPSDTIIIQGDKDGQVPPADSEELSKMTGAKLVMVPGGHGIDPSYILTAIKQHTSVIKPGLAKKKWKERRKNLAILATSPQFQQLQKFTPPKPSPGLPNTSE